MNVSVEEAGRICSERIAELRAMPYGELARYCDLKLACEVLGNDGNKYAYETWAFYESAVGGDIRVVVCVWAFDGGDWSQTLADAVVVKSPDGSASVWSRIRRGRRLRRQR